MDSCFSTTTGYNTGMGKISFIDQVRQAIGQSGLSQYAICKSCGIDKGNMSRFMKGESGLSLEAIDRIADLIGMKITVESKKVVKHGKRD